MAGVAHHHFRVRAFVCGPGCHIPVESRAWEKFQAIFFMRPDGCRYVVVETEKIEEDWFEVWDLYHDVLDRAGSAHRVGRPAAIVVDKGDYLDALIMKAMHTYER